LAVDASDASTDAGDNAAAFADVADVADVAGVAGVAGVADVADAAVPVDVWINAADATDVADAAAHEVDRIDVANARDVSDVNARDVSAAFSDATYGADATDAAEYVTDVADDSHAMWREVTGECTWILSAEACRCDAHVADPTHATNAIVHAPECVATNSSRHVAM